MKGKTCNIVLIKEKNYVINRNIFNYSWYYYRFRLLKCLKRVNGGTSNTKLSIFALKIKKSSKLN